MEITELCTQRVDDIPYLKALVDSMPRRLEDVISKDENTTKYYLQYFIFNCLMPIVQ